MKDRAKRKKSAAKKSYPEVRDYDRSRRFAPSSSEDLAMGLISVTSELPAPAGEKSPPPRRQK